MRFQKAKAWCPIQPERIMLCASQLDLAGLAARRPCAARRTSDERDEIAAMPFEAPGEFEF
jgi:hypothetical protein